MNISFSTSQLRIFLSTLVATFLVVALQLSGIKPPKLIGPLPQRNDMFFEVISPRLDRVQNTYALHTEMAFIPAVDAAADYDAASAYAVIDFDSGTVLASKNLDKRLPIASLTKIMTSVVALDLASSSDVFTVTETAADKIPTKIAVHAGEKLTLHEALQAALMTSANDATEVIRDGVDQKYGEPIFIKAMNEKALAIGLNNSSFANAQGFDDAENYSTVEDLAILSHYALTNYPEIASIAEQDYTVLHSNANHREFELINWNGLIGVYPATIGIKIGNTGRAGKTTVVLSNRGGKRMMAIVLGAPGIIERDLWAAQLLDLGYEKAAGFTPVAVTEAALRAKYASWYY